MRTEDRAVCGHPTSRPLVLQQAALSRLPDAFASAKLLSNLDWTRWSVVYQKDAEVGVVSAGASFYHVGCLFRQSLHEAFDR
jgi:hypothetical protein